MIETFQIDRAGLQYSVTVQTLNIEKHSQVTRLNRDDFRSIAEKHLRDAIVNIERDVTLNVSITKDPSR